MHKTKYNRLVGKNVKQKAVYVTFLQFQTNQLMISVNMICMVGWVKCPFKDIIPYMAGPHQDPAVTVWLYNNNLFMGPGQHAEWRLSYSQTSGSKTLKVAHGTVNTVLRAKQAGYMKLCSAQNALERPILRARVA